MVIGKQRGQLPVADRRQIVGTRERSPEVALGHQPPLSGHLSHQRQVAATTAHGLRTQPVQQRTQHPRGRRLARERPRPKSSTGWFQAAVRRAKVQEITPHDLRHTCASISISSGVNVLALSRMLGHQSAKITPDTYADLFDTDLDAVAEALDLKCAQSVPKPRQAATAGA
jgi:integrase